jgi:hypothetical protein
VSQFCNEAARIVHLQSAAAAQLIYLVVDLVEDEVLVVFQSKPPSGIDHKRFRKLIDHLNLLKIHHDSAASAAGDIAHLPLLQTSTSGWVWLRLRALIL